MVVSRMPLGRISKFLSFLSSNNVSQVKYEATHTTAKTHTYLGPQKQQVAFLLYYQLV